MILYYIILYYRIIYYYVYTYIYIYTRICVYMDIITTWKTSLLKIQSDQAGAKLRFARKRL